MNKSLHIGIGITAVLSSVMPFCRHFWLNLNVPYIPEDFIPMLVSVGGSLLLLAYSFVCLSRLFLPVSMLYVSIAGMFLHNPPTSLGIYLTTAILLLLGGITIICAALFIKPTRAELLSRPSPATSAHTEPGAEVPEQDPQPCG